MLITEREHLAKEVRELAERFGRDRTSLVPILQQVKASYSQIDPYAMQVIANELDVHPVEVYSVVSFYAFLGADKQGRFVLRLCRTISCDLQDKGRIARQLENDLGVGFGETTADGKFTLEWANCMGMCDQGPALLVNDRVYTQVTPAKVHQILDECRRVFGAFAPDHKKKNAEWPPAATGPLTYSTIEPEAGLRTALAKPRADIIAQVTSSGLKGRGGAGFPAGLKLNFAAAERGDKKCVICNADEGEPGTFKDRVILSEFPDLVFEGMTIAGRAIGADEGVVYLRAEYSSLRRHLEDTLAGRRERGLLGNNVLGTEGFDFDIRIHMGAGAYVCGEETALIESLEGHRGEPRNRPPFPVNTGFLGKPSTVNNVETLANIACILAKGADWFKTMGTSTSTGHKLLSVSGDCARPGVYEFPLGVTIAEVLEHVGGEDAKAVQVGGAAGICVPCRAFERSIAFEDVPTGGSFIVLGPQRDLLDVAHNFLEFFVDESCGQCPPCRLGNRKLLEGVELLRRGECSMAHINELLALGETMEAASKCGLGQTSSSAFVSIVHDFGEEIMGRTDGATPRQGADHD